MAYPKGLEPSTLRVGVSRSIQLSYGYKLPTDKQYTRKPAIMQDIAVKAGAK